MKLWPNFGTMPKFGLAQNFYAKLWKFLHEIKNFHELYQIWNFEIFGLNLVKFIAPASSILAKTKIWPYDQKKNPKKPHKTVIKILIWNKNFFAIFLPRSSTPSKWVNLTIFVFLRDLENQNIIKIFMRFLMVPRLNI